jgi:hypothetical protein
MGRAVHLVALCTLLQFIEAGLCSTGHLPDPTLDCAAYIVKAGGSMGH